MTTINSRTVSRPQPTTQPTQWRMGAVLCMLAIALVAFEIFNFDTTRFALTNLLGEVEFFGIHWAAILAIAFCGIDFAGLLRILAGNGEGSKEAWYLLIAWLLGATMNAVMTWYAITIILVSEPIGNEVISRDTLLQGVPIFVAVLVWLTRILFIGSMSVAFEGIHNPKAHSPPRPQPVHPQAAQQRQAAVLRPRPVDESAATPTTES